MLLEAQHETGRGGEESGWPQGRDGLPTGRVLRRTLAAIAHAAGLAPIRVHDLRHTAASLLLSELAEHQKIVQELLGHASIGITMDTYSHVPMPAVAAATRRLGELISRESSPEEQDADQIAAE